MSQPVAVDDVVIIKDSNAKVCQWMMGRITSVIPGSDGVIRVATIKTKQGEVKRAVHSLCILPITKPDPDTCAKNYSEYNVQRNDPATNAILLDESTGGE